MNSYRSHSRLSLIDSPPNPPYRSRPSNHFFSFFFLNTSRKFTHKGSTSLRYIRGFMTLKSGLHLRNPPASGVYLTLLNIRISMSIFLSTALWFKFPFFSRRYYLISTCAHVLAIFFRSGPVREVWYDYFTQSSFLG